MGSLGFCVRNGDRDILVPLRHACGGLCWSGRRRVVSREEERGGPQGRSFDLQAYPGQFAALASLIARHSEIPVIINHLGMPVISDTDGISLWRKGMRALAASQHVHVKLSGVGFIRRDWTIPQITPFLLEAIDMFGPDRCLFASDYPTDKLFGSFDRHLDAYSEIVSGFSEGDRRNMFGRNAARIYRMDIDL